MLHPQFPTCTTASSSSISCASDIETNPSDDAEKSMAALEGALPKCTAVISSEWVDPWVRNGAAGLRGSLSKGCVQLLVDISRRVLPIENECIFFLEIGPRSNKETII